MQDEQFRELEVKVRTQTPLNPIRTPDDAAEMLRARYGDSLQEHFVVVMLDGRHRPISWTVVSKGTQTASLVHPREVFMPAIREGSCAILVVHNHPSGETTPSAEDRTVTKRLAQAGDILGVKLVDHVIVGASHRYSFRENNPDFLDGSGKGVE